MEPHTNLDESDVVLDDEAPELIDDLSETFVGATIATVGAVAFYLGTTTTDEPLVSAVVAGVGVVFAVIGVAHAVDSIVSLIVTWHSDRAERERTQRDRCEFLAIMNEQRVRDRAAFDRFEAERRRAFDF